MTERENKMVTISVIMPAYNEEKHIEQALASICIQKGDFNIEIIVIDDGSTDRTKEVVEDFDKKLSQNKYGFSDNHISLTFIENEGSFGVADARNTGIRKAKGEFIAFLDADDWWEKDKLNMQLSFMKKSGAVLCATGRELMHHDGTPMNKIINIPDIITYKMLLRTNYIPCSSVMMKTDVAREFYMCHDELHEDYILWLRILKKYGQVYGINKPMLKSRMSKGGKSRNKLKSAGMQIGCYRLMGYGIVKSMYYFVAYMVNGVKKYGMSRKVNKT